MCGGMELTRKVVDETLRQRAQVGASEFWRSLHPELTPDEATQEIKDKGLGKLIAEHMNGLLARADADLGPELPEDVKWPVDKDGELLEVGEEYESPSGEADVLTCVEFRQGSRGVSATAVLGERGRRAVPERLCRAADSMRKVQADSRMDPTEYCRRRKVPTGGVPARAMIDDLMARVRLLETERGQA